MIGHYNYTVILTYIGTLFGFTGVISIWNGNLKMSLICLMAAGICDMFDGKIASTMDRTKAEKRFGVQIDSLSDLICFGVLPALIILHCAGNTLLQIIISAAYVLCALIRLAWFNVDEEQRQDSAKGERKTYLGLPVTSVALIIPLFVGASQIMNLALSNACPWILLLIAIAFISPIPLGKPGASGKTILTLCGIAALVLVLIGVKA